MLYVNYIAMKTKQNNHATGHLNNQKKHTTHPESIFEDIKYIVPMRLGLNNLFFKYKFVSALCIL